MREYLKIGLLGYPVAHSLSPVIHASFMRDTAWRGEYTLWSMNQPEELKQFVHYVKECGIHGFNVTIPHKHNIINYLDKIDDLAKKISAVNVVVHERGMLHGYNTDVFGVEYLLRVNNIDCQGRRVLLLGCGGAARAAAQVFADRKCEIYCYTRDVNNENAVQMRRICDKISFVQEQSWADFDNAIIVNAMPEQPAVELMQNAINGRIRFAGAIDLNYYPEITQFMYSAGACKFAVNGLDMLIGQAARAFELWTGVYPVIQPELKAQIITTRGI